jgi:hypothetical protein
MSHRRYVVIFQRDTQQEKSATKHAVRRRTVTATLGRVNEASFPVMFICCYYELRRTARRVLRRKRKACCCIAKQETYELSYCYS